MSEHDDWDDWLWADYVTDGGILGVFGNKSSDTDDTDDAEEEEGEPFYNPVTPPKKKSQYDPNEPLPERHMTAEEYRRSLANADEKRKRVEAFRAAQKKREEERLQKIEDDNRAFAEYQRQHDEKYRRAILEHRYMDAANLRNEQEITKAATEGLGKDYNDFRRELAELFSGLFAKW